MCAAVKSARLYFGEPALNLKPCAPPEVTVRSVKAPMKICERVYQVGGPEMSSANDCCVYLLDGAGPLALIDSGCGPGYPAIVANIIRLGFEPDDIETLLLTHCHIDHVGAAWMFKRDYGVRIVAHEKDSAPLESGDRLMTAAFLYNLRFEPLAIDEKLSGESTIKAGDVELHVVETPGHTPGSVSAYTDVRKTRILFGQDIHGPFHPDFGSDISAWRESMRKLLGLEADILCEGHFGIYSTRDAVRAYIQGYLDRM
jgi:glyoxylase-like metal-dependent hydrolase (beta-lactamase superfamily II)